MRTIFPMHHTLLDFMSLMITKLLFKLLGKLNSDGTLNCGWSHF